MTKRQAATALAEYLAERPVALQRPSTVGARLECKSRAEPLRASIKASASWASTPCGEASRVLEGAC